MKLNKQILKQIIKEELEAVMSEASDSDALNKQLKKLGCKEGGEWGSYAKHGKDGHYDYNNGYIGFVDRGRLYEWYCEDKGRQAMEAIEAAGYTKGSVALPSSNLNPGQQNRYGR